MLAAPSRGVGRRSIPAPPRAPPDPLAPKADQEAFSTVLADPSSMGRTRRQLRWALLEPAAQVLCPAQLSAQNPCEGPETCTGRGERRLRPALTECRHALRHAAAIYGTGSSTEGVRPLDRVIVTQTTTKELAREHVAITEGWGRVRCSTPLFERDHHRDAVGPCRRRCSQNSTCSRPSGLICHFSPGKRVHRAAGVDRQG